MTVNSSPEQVVDPANKVLVITILIVNSDNLPPTSFSPVFESAGLASKVYTPSSQPTQLSDWPTLSDMIDAGTTVVAFMDYEADISSVGYLLNEFAAMWEDPYGKCQLPA